MVLCKIIFDKKSPRWCRTSCRSINEGKKNNLFALRLRLAMVGNGERRNQLNKVTAYSIGRGQSTLSCFRTDCEAEVEWMEKTFIYTSTIHCRWIAFYAARPSIAQFSYFLHLSFFLTQQRIQAMSVRIHIPHRFLKKPFHMCTALRERKHQQSNIWSALLLQRTKENHSKNKLSKWRKM